MDTERLRSFLQSVESAETRGVVFDRPIVEQALVAVTEGRLPPSTDQSILEGFLVFVGGSEADGIFDIREREHAAWFLDRLRKGNYQSPIPELSVITRAPPSPISPSSVALPIPAGTQPAFDLLIRAPHDSLLELYNQAAVRNVGTPQQLRAIEKVLWLRPLGSKDYRLAVEFLESLQKSPVTHSIAQREQGRFLIELLAPGSDPHRMVKHLRTSGLVQRIRIYAGTEPMVIEVVPKTSGTMPIVHSDLLELSTVLQQGGGGEDSHFLGKVVLVTKKVARRIHVLKLDGMSLQPMPTKPVSKMLQPLPPFQHDNDAWKLFGEFATSPGMNALLMPLGVVEHVMATFITGEISWQESWDEGVGAVGGSMVMGGGLLATVFTWHQASKVLTDPRIKIVLDTINGGVSPRVRGYLLPALFLSAFAFMALRASQDLPIEEVWLYRRNMFQEMLEGLGMGYVVTGGALFTFHRLATLGGRSVGKNGARGIWLTAMAAGFLAQELWSSWRRQQKNREFKENTYKAIVEMFDVLPTVPEHMRAPILENCDRKFAVLVALNMLEFSSIKEAIEYSTKQAQILENYRNSGLPETWAKKLATMGEKKEPLTQDQQEFLQYWLSKTGENKERASMLPVSMLSAQRRRILGLWQTNLADVYQFLAKPVPIMIGRNADGSIPSGQFSDWHVAHTMALLRQYAALRERLQVQNGPLPHPVNWH